MLLIERTVARNGVPFQSTIDRSAAAKYAKYKHPHNMADELLG
jgi:hypothetical protein